MAGIFPAIFVYALVYARKGTPALARRCRPMRALLCHNPTAGSKGHDKDAILAALKLADIDVRYISLKSEGWEDALKDAAKKNADLVIAAGGDGTIGKVLIALPDRSLPVALLPLGTANNAARSLGIAGTPQELVETWKLERTAPFDIGCLKSADGTGRFLEAFGVGLFAEYLQLANKGKKPEGADNLRKGREFIQKALKDAEPIDVQIVIDGRAVRGEFLGVEVMNIPFTGPGLPLAGKADASDGKLDVIMFDIDQRKDLIEWLNAPLESPPPVTSRKGATVQLTWADAPTRIDDRAYDNDGKKLAADLTCEEEQVQVLIPVKHPAQQMAEAKAKSA
jgi:diacylglycerol kinase family enzyme